MMKSSACVTISTPFPIPFGTPPEDELGVYLLQTDIDVRFGPEMGCIAHNFQEAYDYLFTHHPNRIEI
jgi:hypothetical protein